MASEKDNSVRRFGPWLLLAAVIATTVAACETTEGFGRDVGKAGDGIEEAAQDAKK